MHAQHAVRLDERWTEQCGKLPGSGAAHEIHLEKPVLRMDEAGCECEVNPRARTKGGSTERVSFDGSGRADSGKSELTFEVWQAAMQREISRGRSKRDQSGESRSNVADQAAAESGPTSRQKFRFELLGGALTIPRPLVAIPWPHTFTSRIFIAFVLPETPDSSPFVRMMRSPTSTMPRSSITLKMSA